MRIRLSSTVALWLNRVIFLTVIALGVGLPWIADYVINHGYHSVRAATVLVCAYYACCPVVLLALWKLDALLRQSSQKCFPITVKCPIVHMGMGIK